MSGFRNPHYPYMNDEGYDVEFIDAAFYDRERACQMPVTQREIQHFAPKDVPVLALPILYCLGCGGQDHPCAYTHKLDATIGTCNLERVKDAHSYVPSERVQIIAEQTYTGRIQRKATVKAGK